MLKRGLLAALLLVSHTSVAGTIGGQTSGGSGNCPVDGSGVTPPATCTLCHLWFDSDLDTTGNFVTCIGSNTWRAVDTKGASGGGGDASTDTASSVVGEIALFKDTAGKILKRATGTGICELTSGVMSANSPTGSGAVVKATSPTFVTNVTLPASTTPSTSGAGKTAFKTDAWGSGHGTVQFGDGTSDTLCVNVLASSTPFDEFVPHWHANGVTWEVDAGGSGTGNVTGPISSVVGALALFNATNGSLLKTDGTPGVPIQSSGAVTMTGTTGLGLVARQNNPVLTGPTLVGPATDSMNGMQHDHSSGPAGGNLHPDTAFGTNCCLNRANGGTGTNTATGTGAVVYAADPTFSGDPKVPTAAASDNDNSAASTAQVRGAINAAAGLGMTAASGVLSTDLGALGVIPNSLPSGGAGQGGKLGVNGAQPLSYTDYASTPSQRYAAYGNSAGAATSTANGSVPIASLTATGTPNGSNFLCGDNTWGTCNVVPNAAGSSGDVQIKGSGAAVTFASGLNFDSNGLHVPAPGGDGTRGQTFDDNTSHQGQPSAAKTSLESFGGRFYQRSPSGAPDALQSALLNPHVCEFTWTGTTTAAANDATIKCSIPAASTLTRLYCYTSTGTFDVNLYSRAEATPGTGTTKLKAADLTCGTTGATATTFSTSALGAHSLLVFNLVSTTITGTLGVHAEYTTP